MNESATFVPLVPEEGDRFGESVAISDGQHGLRAVIGVPREDGETDNIGAAYVFRYDEKAFAWVREARLVNPDPEHGGSFASSVGIDGETLVVGKPSDNELAGGAGAAYVYRFNGVEWVKEAKLLASDGRRLHNFGIAIDIAGDTIVVGARSRNINKDAYVFRYAKGEWVEEAILRPEGDGSSGFGQSVDIAGDRIIVGALWDFENGPYSGAAYVFRFNGATWIRETKLLAEDGERDAYFGRSVAIDGDQALVGAPDSGDGAAYVFRFDRRSGQWRQERKLIPPEGFVWFGRQVALNGELAAIRSRSHYDRDPDVDSVFVYWRADWAPVATLRAEGGISRDGFGSDVALAGETLVVGAFNEAVDGRRSGAAHVFHDIFADCNDNGRPDLCDIHEGTSPDCNDNGVPDACDLERGSSEDENEDGLPDDCQGACCALEGTCQSYVPEGVCAARYTPAATCEELNPPCTEAIGACCEDNGRCTEDVPYLQCGGRFIEGGACGDFWPQCIQQGACCDRQGSCEDDVPRGECSDRFVPFERCADLDPPCGEELGACCVAGVCAGTMPLSDCEDLGGRWFADEDCGAGFECPLEEACPAWDNGIEWNMTNGRAISPPGFPDIRVADDFAIPEGGCTIYGVRLTVIQDAGWNDGGVITITVYEDTGGAGPGEIVAQTTTEFESEDVSENDECGWGRSCYLYTVEHINLSLPGGNYWLGARNPRAGGTGTNYWMTSDGGVDGSTSETGWFSLNGGETFMPEGADWHHAFTINLDDTEWACCTDGQCAMKPRYLCETTCRRDPAWVCDGDVDGDGQVNPVDAGLVAAAFGSIRERDLCSYDVDCDGQINPVDAGIVQSLFGVCNAPRSTCGAGEWLKGVDCGNFECP